MDNMDQFTSYFVPVAHTPSTWPSLQTKSFEVKTINIICLPNCSSHHLVLELVGESDLVLRAMPMRMSEERQLRIVRGGKEHRIEEGAFPGVKRRSELESYRATAGAHLTQFVLALHSRDLHRFDFNEPAESSFMFPLSTKEWMYVT